MQLYVLSNALGITGNVFDLKTTRNVLLFIHCIVNVQVWELFGCVLDESEGRGSVQGTFFLFAVSVSLPGTTGSDN